MSSDVLLLHVTLYSSRELVPGENATFQTLLRNSRKSKIAGPPLGILIGGGQGGGRGGVRGAPCGLRTAVVGVTVRVERAESGGHEMWSES